MRLDWQAMGVGFGVYWLLSAPIYFPWHLALARPFSEGISWLPAIAAVVCGVVFSFVALANRDRDCIVLGLFISLSVFLVNLAVQFFELPLVLPTAKFYFFHPATSGAEMCMLLVLVGSTCGMYVNAKKKRT